MSIRSKSLIATISMVAIYVIALVLVLASRGEASDPNEHYATSQYGAQVCFPFHLWNASTDNVPCDIINAPQEDGSGRLYLGTFSGDRAECVIPNPQEERGAFTIPCHRVRR